MLQNIGRHLPLHLLLIFQGQNRPSQHPPIKTTTEQIHTARIVIVPGDTRHHPAVALSTGPRQPRQSLPPQIKQPYLTIIVRYRNHPIHRHRNTIHGGVGANRRHRRTHISQIPHFDAAIVRTGDDFVFTGEYCWCYTPRKRETMKSVLEQFWGNYSVCPWKTETEWTLSLKSHRRKVVSLEEVTASFWVGWVEACVSSWSCPKKSIKNT